MRYLLQLCVLFVLLAPSAVLGADQIRLAQNFPDRAPGSSAAAAAANNDSRHLQYHLQFGGDERLNTCVGLSPQLVGERAVELTCTTQQLVCKQRC